MRSNVTDITENSGAIKFHIDSHMKGHGNLVFPRVIKSYPDGGMIIRHLKFEARHARMLMVFLEQWEEGKFEFPETRGCIIASTLAKLVPKMNRQIAPMTEKTIYGYIYEIRRTAKVLGPQFTGAIIQSVRSHGFRAGWLLRDAEVVIREAG